MVRPEGNSGEGGQKFPAHRFQDRGAGRPRSGALACKLSSAVEAGTRAECGGGFRQCGPVRSDARAVIGDRDCEESALRKDKGVSMDGTGGVEDKDRAEADRWRAIGVGQIGAGQDKHEGSAVVLVNGYVFST